MLNFTIRIRKIDDDDPMRPMATCRATIDEEPDFIVAWGLCPAEAIGHAILYLSRISRLELGVRLSIVS